MGQVENMISGFQDKEELGQISKGYDFFKTIIHAKKEHAETGTP